MTNPYLDFAQSILPRRRKWQVKVVKSERDAPKVLRGADLALAERNKQFARAKRWETAKLRELLAGPWGQSIRKVLNFLHRMKIDDGDSLIALLDDLDWFAGADHSIRMHILAEINDAIITLRICNGFSPIADALPGEQPTVFQIIRAKLNHEETVK